MHRANHGAQCRLCCPVQTGAQCRLRLRCTGIHSAILRFLYLYLLYLLHEPREAASSTTNSQTLSERTELVPTFKVNCREFTFTFFLSMIECCSCTALHRFNEKLLKFFVYYKYSKFCFIFCIIYRFQST